MNPKLIVCGAAGRMGRRILALAAQQGGFDIIGAVERKGHPDLGKETAGLKLKLVDTFPEGADVVIDFSSPEAAETTIDYCLENSAAMVLCTTGLGERQQQKIKAASAKIPVIYGTNMSVGMNILFSLVGKTAKIFGEDCDIELIEQHHKFKKDAPSGSALTLAENICKATGRDYPESLTFGREGKDVVRKKGEIGMHSVRAGDIVGIHSVIFSTPGETVTLNHTAQSRDTFAQGALRAAQWLIGKKAGQYAMADCLEIS